MSSLLTLVVLGALAWYSFENGMEFFGFLVVLAGILLLFTQKPQSKRIEESDYPYPPGQQPIVIDSGGGGVKGTKEINLKVKRWRDRWGGHPQEYIMLHTGIAVDNLARSVLYIFGLEKDKKKKK